MQATILSPAMDKPPESSAFTRYESLVRLSQSIRTQREPKELFRLLVSELSKVVQFDAIAQFDEAASKIHWHLCDNYQKPNAAAQLPKEETLAWWVYQHQQTLVISSVERETRFPRMMECLRGYGVQSVCALPLSTAHRRLGSLLIASELPDAYSEEEVRFLSLVVDQIALATDDALNFEASQRAQNRLELLLGLTNRVVSNLELRDLLREISASIRNVMQCDGVGVTLPDQEDGTLRLYALDFPGSKGIIREGLTGAEEEASATVFRTGRPMHLTGSELDQDHIALAEGARSVCHLPLISRDRVLGVLHLGSLQENAFTEDDVAFLSKVAGQVAIAVENARAYGQIADLRDKLAQEKLYLEDEIRSELNFEEIVGKSDALRRVLKEVETVAPTDSTVLIYGETGTGKELIARAVHN